MKISDFYYKKLRKMIADPNYDLNEKYAPRLLDMGFIELKNFYQSVRGFHVDCSYFTITELGKKAYKEWDETHSDN